MWNHEHYRDESFAVPDFLLKAPGPSPWYLRTVDPLITSKHGNLRWSYAGHDGLMFLSTPNDQVLAVFDFYCYVLPLPNRKFLVWYQQHININSLDNIILTIIDADNLTVIEDTETAIKEMKSEHLRVHHEGGQVSTFEISNDLSEGKHTSLVPKEFTTIDEILVIARSTIVNGICIFDLKPQTNSIEVIPQDWFNNGSFDFGYQWPTRVARDPDTGKVFGEGFRLGVFLLDDSLRHVSKWFVMDPFYRPE